MQNFEYCHDSTITITKMVKIPFVSDPRYSDSPSHEYRTQEKLKEDVSSTQRSPYPKESGLARVKMKK